MIHFKGISFSCFTIERPSRGDSSVELLGAALGKLNITQVFDIYCTFYKKETKNIVKVTFNDAKCRGTKRETLFQIRINQSSHACVCLCMRVLVHVCVHVCVCMSHAYVCVFFLCVCVCVYVVMCVYMS